MTLTPTRTGQRRSNSQLVHIAALADLSSRADRIRYACDQLAATGQPIAPQMVRTWLAEHDAAEDPDDARQRSYVSRTVNQWRNDRETAAAALMPAATPPETALGTDADRDQDPPDAPDVHGDSTRAPAIPHDPTVHANGSSVHTTEHTSVHSRVHPEHTEAAAAEPIPGADEHAFLHEICLQTETNSAAPTVHTSGSSVHTTEHTGVHTPRTLTITDPVLLKRSRRVRWAAYSLLAVVAVAGAVLSYDSLATKAREFFPDPLAYMFPVLVDLLIVGASLAYLAGTMTGRGRPGWRLLAHAGVAGTVTLNALTSASAAGIPWHITPAIVWAVLVELVARDLLGDYRAQHARPDRIPLLLWVTAPGESASTWLRVHRQAAHATARTHVGTHAAAREALRMALPGRRARRVRRVIARQLRAGSLTPQAVLDQATTLMQHLDPNSPEAVLRDVLTHTTHRP